jgi:hypothetical protein
MKQIIKLLFLLICIYTLGLLIVGAIAAFLKWIFIN